MDAFTGVEKQYLVSDRTKYTPEQQKCIDRVELAHKKLEDLRGVDGSFGFEDDLDLLLLDKVYLLQMVWH